MQPNKINNTNCKWAIVDVQYSITNIKNNLKYSIQGLRNEKIRAISVDCDLIIFVDNNLTTVSVFIIIYTIIIGWSLKLLQNIRLYMWFL